MSDKPWSFTFQDESEELEFKKFQVLVRDLKQEDNILLRFFRARDRNLKKAEEMIRKSVCWRNENDINSYVNWLPPPDYHKFRITFKVTGLDYKRRPVFWMPFGSFLAKESIEEGYKEDCFKYLYHVMELGQKLQRDNDVSQSVAILDFEHLSFSQVMHLESMRTIYQMAQIMEQNYPEVLRRLIAINTPWMFPVGYNFVKPVLAVNTISKIELYNSDKQKWLPRLCELVPVKSLPKHYFEDENI